MPTRNERDYYARRAAEIRQFADNTQDPETQKTLRAMAESYDRLVEEADRIVTLRDRLDQA